MLFRRAYNLRPMMHLFCRKQCSRLIYSPKGLSGGLGFVQSVHRRQACARVPEVRCCCRSRERSEDSPKPPHKLESCLCADDLLENGQDPGGDTSYHIERTRRSPSHYAHYSKCECPRHEYCRFRKKHTHGSSMATEHYRTAPGIHCAPSQTTRKVFAQENGSSRDDGRDVAVSGFVQAFA